jgi:hypothetical protein
MSALLLVFGAMLFIFAMQPLIPLLFFPRRKTCVETASPPYPVTLLKMSPGVSIPRLIPGTVLPGVASPVKPVSISPG